MTNHPSRSKANPGPRSPTKDEVIAARERSGLTPGDAAKLIYSTTKSWERWEAGERPMHPAMFELFELKAAKIKTNGRVRQMYMHVESDFATAPGEVRPAFRRPEISQPERMARRRSNLVSAKLSATINGIDTRYSVICDCGFGVITFGTSDPPNTERRCEPDGHGHGCGRVFRLTSVTGDVESGQTKVEIDVTGRRYAHEPIEPPTDH
jgi:putative transcriptional regulator